MPSATYEIPALAIALLPANERARAKDYAAYSLEWLPLSASASRAKASFTVASDVDFVALFVAGEVTDTAAPPVHNATPMATLSLEAADRKLFDKEVHWQTFAGNVHAAPGAFPLPFPLYLPRATTLVGFLSNLTATVYNYRLTLHGFVIHEYPRSQSRGY